MLESPRGLSGAALEALAALEQRVLAADGGRLKLEWGMLRERSGEEVDDLLWWDGEQLAGFVGLYSFGSSVELSGMVDPAARRRGVGARLLEAALALCRERASEQVLLVVPRSSLGARRLALAHAGTLDHSEHAMALVDDPAPGPSDPRTRLRPAGASDGAELSRILETAFGHPVPPLDPETDSAAGRTLMVEVEGEAIGTVRLTRDGDAAGVYGLAVDPAWQGRGIGRDVLRRVCVQLREEGACRIGLEVLVDNDRALGLYSSIGFTAVAIEDYYDLPLAPSQS
jgi:ribosomal protein S18 acetylase RimI-like enzyme